MGALLGQDTRNRMVAFYSGYMSDAADATARSWIRYGRQVGPCCGLFCLRPAVAASGYEESAYGEDSNLWAFMSGWGINSYYPDSSHIVGHGKDREGRK